MLVEFSGTLIGLTTPSGYARSDVRDLKFCIVIFIMDYGVFQYSYSFPKACRRSSLWGNFPRRIGILFFLFKGSILVRSKYSISHIAEDGRPTCEEKSLIACRIFGRVNRVDHSVWICPLWSEGFGGLYRDFHHGLWSLSILFQSLPAFISPGKLSSSDWDSFF